MDEKEETSKATNAIFSNCWIPNFNKDKVKNSFVDSCVFLSTKYVSLGF